MPAIAFYRQKRLDNGVRTGIETDVSHAWESYEVGDPEHDPRLLWFIDLIFEGESLPSEPDEVRMWLLGATDAITRGLKETADGMGIGFDAELQPLQSAFDCGQGVNASLSVSAVRRFTGPEMASELHQLAASWTAILNRLERLSCV